MEKDGNFPKNSVLALEIFNCLGGKSQYSVCGRLGSACEAGCEESRSAPFGFLFFRLRSYPSVGTLQEVNAEEVAVAIAEADRSSIVSCAVRTFVGFRVVGTLQSVL